VKLYDILKLNVMVRCVCAAVRLAGTQGHEGSLGSAEATLFVRKIMKL
jgi:hypothetical protein